MEYKETYEKFWEEAKNTKFGDYERNLLLYYFFPETKNNEKLVDIAGGAGIVAGWLIKRGYDVSLVEFSEVAVEEAKKRGINKIFKNKIEGQGSLPFTNDSFDVVFFGDIIEHLFDPESAIKELKRILRANGKLVISCPNIAYWRFRWYYLFDGDFQRIDVAKQRPWEQEHIRYYNIKILKELLGGLGFEFIKYKGVNCIWHSKFLVKYIPNIFSHTLIAEFKNIK
ncbi:MAG: methyltransferase domain-containing protein [Patescibacteria group bacterium]|nr:methyltransferase domain-containing protein [Patescibacteria group bacterium]